LETPVFDPKTLKNRFFLPKQGFLTPKQGFLTPKQGFLTQKQGIISKLNSKLFSRVQKDQIFPKNFRTSITELFQNSRKQKLGKFPLLQGIILNYILSLKNLKMVGVFILANLHMYKKTTHIEGHLVEKLR